MKAIHETTRNFTDAFSRKRLKILSERRPLLRYLGHARSEFRDLLNRRACDEISIPKLRFQFTGLFLQLFFLPRKSGAFHFKID